MNIPVCVRDGCATGNIQIGRFDFEIDLSELLDIVGAARLELRDSLLSNRNILDSSLRCMDEVLRNEMRKAKKPIDSDNAKNLKRWQTTGCGGHTDLNEIRAILLKDDQDQRASHEARELDRSIAWQAVRKEREAAWKAEMGKETLAQLRNTLDFLVCREDLECSECENGEECYSLSEKIDKLENA